MLFVRFKYATYNIPTIGIIANLFGTFLHELSHYLMAVITNGQPIGLSLFPQIYNEEIILGSVTFRNSRWYNNFPIAFAPLLLLIGAYYLDFWYVHEIAHKTLWTDLGYLFVLVLLVENSIPSWTDVKVAASDLFGFVLYGSLVVVFVMRYLFVLFPA